MKTPRIAISVGYIDDDLITAAAESKKKRKNTWVKWGALAACFTALIVSGAAILPLLRGGDTPIEANNRYKDFNIRVEDSGIIWPWEYQTVYEKYTELKIDGEKYYGKCREVSSSYVGNCMGNYTVAGYDESNNSKKHTEDFEVYALKDVAPSQFVAAKMGDKYYVFKNGEYAPPSTLGEMMECVDLSKAVELGHFSKNDDGPDGKHYVLNNDDYIWTVLAECENAPFVKDQNWTVRGREYLSFTVNSEVLGVYKVAMYVTEDGYLWTNAFSYQYLFNIGDDAASKIIKHAKENSMAAEYEPYQNSVIGIITEITDEYILVDDSVLCNNSADGIGYMVLLNDLRISRYVNLRVLKVGDTVQITYEGEIDGANTIDTAIYASEVKIFDGDVLIPE